MKPTSGNDIWKQLQRWSIRLLNLIILGISIIAPLGIIYMFGFPQSPEAFRFLQSGYQSMLIVIWLAFTLRVLIGGEENQPRKNTQRMRIAFYVVLTAIAVFNLAVRYDWLVEDHFLSAISAPWMVIIILLIISGIELAKAISKLLSRRINPSVILAISFVILILIGSFLLMLPNSTHNGIRYIDSIFTAASAVCITGMTTVSIPETFTLTGQVIILVLVQIGALGIMTITSFFTLFFMGQASLKSQFLLSDMMSSDMMGGLGKTLLKIILVTFSIEVAGALLLFSVVNGAEAFATESESLHFSIFHSITAFCNAGFSSLPGNLYDPAVRYVSAIPIIIGWMVIFGGIGFPIFSNLLSILGDHIKNLFRLLLKRPIVRKPRRWSLNSFIVLKTTGILLAGAWVFVLIVEWNHSLAEFSVIGKLAQGFLIAVTPRSSGFTGVNLHQMLPVTLILMSVLMWIGGGPQSTAGGIKVTTFYLAVKNIVATMKGTPKIESHNREIPSHSVRRAFAVITIWLGTMIVAFGILTLLEPGQKSSHLLFETISALGTVGLSLGVTPELGAAAKSLLIVLMFVGRVGILSLMAAIVKPHTEHPYEYPQEGILIN